MSNNNNSFWVSYSDLMTSLFFIMLVLFVLTVVMLKREQIKIIARLEEYQKIEEIKKAINAINPEYFEYRPEFKKHIFKLSVEFPTDSFNIHSINNKNLLPKIEDAGREIEKIISAFSSIENIQYLVVIEGQASRDGASYNDLLSFKRALALKVFWESKNIFLNNIENCELIVAGSGEGGIPREQPDFRNPQNQRFLIHIIPKTGEISPNL